MKQKIKTDACQRLMDVPREELPWWEWVLLIIIGVLGIPMAISIIVVIIGGL